MAILPHQYNLCKVWEINPTPKTNSRMMADRATKNEKLRLKK